MENDLIEYVKFINSLLDDYKVNLKLAREENDEIDIGYFLGKINALENVSFSRKDSVKVNQMTISMLKASAENFEHFWMEALKCDDSKQCEELESIAISHVWELIDIIKKI